MRQGIELEKGFGQSIRPTEPVNDQLIIGLINFVVLTLITCNFDFNYFNDIGQ